MSNIKELLDFQIYPSIYQKIESSLPEFGFKRTSGGYVSTTNIKIDGSTGKAGKVYLYDNNISVLIDYTRGNTSLWKYFQEKHALKNYETLKYLADLAGVNISSEYKNEELELIKETNKLAEIWEEANSFFVSTLNQNPQELKTYLDKRAYNLEDIKNMELGFINSQEALKNHLEEKGFSEDEINKNIQLNFAIGNTHQLTIPYRDNMGRIRGLIARNINYSETDKLPKYLYSTGLKRDDTLFNLKPLKGTKELIIVEGILDCLIAQSKGISNVIALGGTSLNLKQLELIKKYAPKKITLCLDNDEAGKKATLKAIELIKSTNIKLYISTLPEEIKDPDQLIKEKGIETFTSIINDSESYYLYMLEQITAPYREKSVFTDKERDEIIDATYDLLVYLHDPIEKELFYSVLTDITNGKVTKETFQHKAEKIKAERLKFKQEKELSKIIYESQELLKEGNLKLALEVVNTGSQEILLETTQEILEKYNYDSFLEEMKQTPLTLKTGITTLDKIARIPHGAITLIAGRPSHGKTTFMFNLLLNMSSIYKDKKFYFFSYEEQKKFILAKILNRLINKDIQISEYTDANTNLEKLKAYLRDDRSDIKYIEDSKKKLKDLLEAGKIEIIDKAYSVEDLSLVIEHLNSKENIGCVFIDYIQRIRTKLKTQDKRNEIAYISDYILNNIAKKTGLPIVLGAQFNRGAGESPKLEHLKEAGNLEEDANLVLSVYQEARENEQHSGERDVELEIKAIKNRDGAVNVKTNLKFDRYTGNISDYSLSWR